MPPGYRMPSPGLYCVGRLQLGITGLVGKYTVGGGSSECELVQGTPGSRLRGIMWRFDCNGAQFAGCTGVYPVTCYAVVESGDAYCPLRGLALSSEEGAEHQPVSITTPRSKYPWIVATLHRPQGHLSARLPRKKCSTAILDPVLPGAGYHHHVPTCTNPRSVLPVVVFTVRLNVLAKLTRLLSRFPK